MLVLTRKIGQKIIIDETIEITVVDVRGDTIKLGVVAPKQVSVYREELLQEVREANTAAKQTDGQTLERVMPLVKQSKPTTETP